MIALALALLAAQSPKDLWPDRHVDGWTIGTASDSGCSAIVSFINKETKLSSNFFIFYSQGKDNVYLSFQDDKFKSLKEGEKYDIGVKLMINRQLDSGWGTNKFTAHKDADDVGGRLGGGFEGRQMLTDIAKASGIGFYKGDDIIAAFSMEGSAKIIDLLRQCAATVERHNPTDPFAK